MVASSEQKSTQTILMCPSTLMVMRSLMGQSPHKFWKLQGCFSPRNFKIRGNPQIRGEISCLHFLLRDSFTGRCDRVTFDLIHHFFGSRHGKGPSNGEKAVIFRTLPWHKSDHLLLTTISLDHTWEGPNNGEAAVIFWTLPWHKSDQSLQTTISLDHDMGKGQTMVSWYVAMT